MNLLNLLTRKRASARVTEPTSYGMLASANAVARYRAMDARRASMQERDGMRAEAARNDALWAGRR